MATYDDENDLDGAAECFKDQCEKEDFEEQEERVLTEQEWEEEKELREEERFLNEQERNRLEVGFDGVFEGG